MTRCPKCKGNGVYFDKVGGEAANKCLLCGVYYTPLTSRQSLERQITGKNLLYGVGSGMLVDELESEEKTR